jgi:hypothetical protein
MNLNFTIMNKLFLSVLFVFISYFVNAQSFDKFYEPWFGFYSPYTILKSDSKCLDKGGRDSKMALWGYLSIEGTSASDKPGGFSFNAKNRSIGDLVYVLVKLLGDAKGKWKLNDINYVSDFILPYFRLGWNVVAIEKTIVNFGLQHGYYFIDAYDNNGNRFVHQGDMFGVGPFVYADRILTKWLAVRVGTGPAFIYVAHGKGKKPLFWESNFELFTPFGIFLGVDLLTAGKLIDGPTGSTGTSTVYNSKFKISRTDLKFGIRFNFKR